MRLNRLVIPASIAAVAAFAGCKYSYSNPAERLSAGEISGRTLADLRVSGTPQPEGGIGVSLKGSAFSQVSHPTGRFTLLPLPPGTHTLVFRRGTELALTRRVELALGRDGQPEGLTLGDVEVPFAGAIAGSVSPSSAGGIVVDEISGLTGFVNGGPGYGNDGQYFLPGASVGLHRLKFGLANPYTSEEWVGGPLEVTIPSHGQSAVTRAALLGVHPAAGTGHVRARLLSLHPDLGADDLHLTVTEAIRGELVPEVTSFPDGRIEFDAPEGLYSLGLSATGPHAGEVTNQPAATIVVLGGEVADAGTLYLVPPGIPLAAQVACQVPEDCDMGPNGPTGPGGGPLPPVCDSGQCPRYWAPPPSLPPNIPYCYTARDLCVNLTNCQFPNGSGTCLDQGNGVQACIRCFDTCTIDGVNVIEGPSCPD